MPVRTTTLMFPSRMVLAAAVLAVLAGGTRAWALDEPIRVSKGSFLSGEKKIRIECFEPKRSGKFPAIVLVPESKSLDEIGPVYREIARCVAEEGYVVALVNFFDGTGHNNGVHPDNIKDADFRLWMQVVRDTVKHVRTLENVQTSRVGLLGFSLGGFLSLSVAREKNLDIAAVGCYFGGLPEQLWKTVRWFPPLLLVHGKLDSIVNLREAERVKGFCDANNLSCQLKVYDKQGHLFMHELLTPLALEEITARLQGRDPQPAQALARAIRTSPIIREAVQTGIRFFAEHLQTTAQTVKDEKR